MAALRDAGGATVVVTSRERLRLSGERVFPVAPLAATDAAELFFARTAALGVDAGDIDAVAELCARLDNLPLAVELAAARAALLAPAEMLARLGGRLDQLSGDRDADPRQQTLRATIAWSHDLLDRSERELFAHFAVFVGGATLDAVETICDADLGVLASLLDKSLVRRTGERVWMLETIREFASEQLDADPGANELRDRHAGYYLAFGKDSEREVRGPGQADVLERLEAERDNLGPRSSGYSTAIRQRRSSCGRALGVLVQTRPLPRGPRDTARRARTGRPADRGQGIRARGSGTARGRPGRPP